ncbi:hypothetical protein ZEAMMB73_Zm00001d051541 [Zea mays]|uniref:Fucosyltransferase n=1 Tax=Zea mays TaxID=4577 RepID=A0A1D6Q7N6_MAIZE|nr:hypothetical protein ZEAMMB73_Zm00001d051541 [Zea mays]
MYHRNPGRRPSEHLVSKPRRHEALQRRCGPGTAAYSSALEQLKSGKNAGASPRIQSAGTSISYRGLGNRILTAASAFLYALLTDCVLIVDSSNEMGELFCEPFPDTTWLLPWRSFPLWNFSFDTRPQRRNRHDIHLPFPRARIGVMRYFGFIIVATEVEEGNVYVGNTAEPSYEVVASSDYSAQVHTNDTDEHELNIESEDSKVSVGNVAKQSHDVVGVGIDCIFIPVKVSTEAGLGPQPDVILLTSLDVPNESSQISSDAIMLEQNKQDALDTLIRISQHKKPKKLNVARVVSEDYKCTPEDVQLIEYIKTLPGKQVVVNIDNAWLNRNDMECLFHGDIQLSGEALSAYIHCIRDEEHLLHREGGKVFLENTFISSLLKRDGDPKVFIPMNIENFHWYLTVLNAKKVRFKLPAILWDSRLNTKKRHQNLDHNVDEDGESSSDVQIIDTPYCFNMAVRMIACNDALFLLEDKYHYMDLQFCILLPYSFLGHFTLYVLNMDTRSIYIMDSMPIPSWFKGDHPSMHYIHNIHYIANNMNAAMELANPTWKDDIYMWHRIVPTWVARTLNWDLSGFLVINFMHDWNGIRLSCICTNGNVLRTKFLVELLKYKDNESKDNIPEEIQEIIRHIRQI